MDLLLEASDLAQDPDNEVSFLALHGATQVQGPFLKSVPPFKMRLHRDPTLGV